MKLNPEVHPLEPKLNKIIEGYHGFDEPNRPLTFAGEELLPEDLVVRLRKGLALFAEERRLAEAHALAVEERDRKLPGLVLLYDQALDVAKRHYGAHPQKMATFVEPKASRTRAPIVRAKPRARRAKSKLVCGDSEFIEERVTTVIEEVVVAGEAASCGCAESPCRCGERKPPRREKQPS